MPTESEPITNMQRRASDLSHQAGVQAKTLGGELKIVVFLYKNSFFIIKSRFFVYKSAYYVYLCAVILYFAFVTIFILYAANRRRKSKSMSRRMGLSFELVL